MDRHFNLVVIGTGFGGTMTSLVIANEFKRRGKHETTLLLERGTWWTTPVGTVQDKEVKAYDFLQEKGHPVQFWSSADHFKGFIDLFLRCVRRKKNEDGLYDFTTFGKRGFLGIGAQNDGVTIARASGVGGGSLIYANVTIRPPELVFSDERWPISWSPQERDAYFELARHAIGYGVLSALQARAAGHLPHTGPSLPPGAVNTGLSNIATRSARIDPHWHVAPDPGNNRGIKRIDPSNTPDPKNALWIDRARVFQSEMSALTNDYGLVDSSINDLPPEPNVFDPAGQPKNYCERQGRCIIGCLPGARHTLNKQLMVAILGKPADNPPTPQFPDMSLEPLSEVDVIEARPGGGYVVHYDQRDQDRPDQKTAQTVTADRVILAAGCVGTNEILLRSKDRGALPHLSEKLGFGFSTNGDYLAFLEGTKERVNLARGPVTTSYAHFNTPIAASTTDPARFHTIEDNGIPRPFSVMTGAGVPLLRSLANGRNPKLFIVFALLLWLLKRFARFVLAFFRNGVERQEAFASEDEVTANIMCVAAMGREAAIGQFRLGQSWGETTLRVSRTDGKPFHEDPIYQEIRHTLDQFAERLTGSKAARFLNPFLTSTARALGAKAIGLSHPLGGCRMARTPNQGTVDEYGRVYDASKGSPGGFYEGLYVADAAIIPTSLGVNPSLTISALALRIADRFVKDLTP